MSLVFETFYGTFMGHFMGQNFKSKAYLELAEEVTENQKKILNNISRNRLVTVKKLSKIVGISERKIKENISKLKQKKLLKRIGPDKGGY